MPQPSDPVCPACGGDVGATSTYCMHCDAEFDAPIEESEWSGGDADARDPGDWGEGTEPTPASDWGDSDQSVTDHPSGWDDGGPGDDGHTEGWSESEESTANATPTTTSDDGTTADTSDGVERTGGDGGGTGRNVLQSVARVGAVLLTVVVGLLTTVAMMLLTVEVIELWLPILAVALVGIVTGGVVVARQDTGLDALADALYVAAAVLVLLPFVFFLLLPTGDPVLDRLAAGLVFSLFGSVLGVPMFVVGWWLQPDDEEIPWT